MINDIKNEGFAEISNETQLTEALLALVDIIFASPTKKSLEGLLGDENETQSNRVMSHVSHLILHYTS